MPWPTKRATDSPASASTLRLVQKREALSVKTKPSGTDWAQFSNVAGLNPE